MNFLSVPHGVNSATRQQCNQQLKKNNNDEVVFAENMGKYHKLFYATKSNTSVVRHINYYPERDTEAIRKFTAMVVCPRCKKDNTRMQP